MLDRRSFLKGVLTVAAIAAMPKQFLTQPMPILWGDGLHDDAPALNAFLNNRPFHTMDGFDGIVEEGLLFQGRFVCMSGLVMDNPAALAIVRNCEFDFSKAPPAPGFKYLVDIRQAHDAVIADSFFRVPGHLSHG